MEVDPDPTQPNRNCPIIGCPCKALERSAAAWGAAATAVSLMDEEPEDPAAVLRLVPPPRR